MITGMKVLEVPYKAIGAELPDLLAGHVSTAYLAPVVVAQLIKSGKLVALGVAGTRRVPIIPELPTLIEQGMTGAVALGWNGLFVPAGTPKPVIQKLQAEVAAITEAAMRGEITDFKDSLRRRVAMLEGVPVTALHEVLTQRLRLNPGARELVQACKASGLQVLLVSGGFTFFADHVQTLLGIDYTRSNVLEISDGHLTGRLVTQDWGDICDGEEKKRMVIQTCEAHGINADECIAVGDGSNDIPMMHWCGLSIAYQAKPKVRQQANIAIDSGGIDRMLEIITPRS